MVGTCGLAGTLLIESRVVYTSLVDKVPTYLGIVAFKLRVSDVFRTGYIHLDISVSWLASHQGYVGSKSYTTRPEQSATHVPATVP